MYASAAIQVRLRADGSPEPTGLEGKYVCPMHPEVLRDEAGRCSICEMNLEQVPGLLPLRVAAAEPGGQPAGVLAIRQSAVLDTGRRQIAYRKRQDGAFELVELSLGPLAEARDESGRTETYYPVLAGLAAGDEVATQGGFLLDSQRQIEGQPSLLYPEGRSAAGLHAGHGGPAAPAPGTAPAGGHRH
jgi:Cu(I)/Ag(I) efflux system membrane fusion protein